MKRFILKNRNDGRRYLRQLRRVLSLVLVLNLLLNSFAFAVAPETEALTPDQLAAIALSSRSEALLGQKVRAENIYTFWLGDRDPMLLSELLREVGMPLALEDITGITQFDISGETLTEDYLVFQPLELDYVVYPIKTFDEAGVALQTAGDIYVLRLTDGVCTDVPADESENYELGGEAEPEAEAETVSTYTARLGEGEARLSDLMARAGMPVAAKAVEMVGFAGNDEWEADYLSIEELDGDYLVSAVQDFDAARLMVYTAEDVYTLTLEDGIAPSETAGGDIEAPDGDIEAPDELMDAAQEQAAGNVGDETPAPAAAPGHAEEHEDDSAEEHLDAPVPEVSTTLEGDAPDQTPEQTGEDVPPVQDAGEDQQTAPQPVIEVKPGDGSAPSRVSVRANKPSDDKIEPEAEEVAGGEAVPGANEVPGGETVPGDGQETDGESIPGEGQGTDGETVPGDVEPADDEIMPEDSEIVSGETIQYQKKVTEDETVSGNGEAAKGETVPEEGKSADDDGEPEEGQPADGETVPEEGESTDGDSKPEEGKPADGDSEPEEGKPADGETVPEESKPADGDGEPEEGQPADGEPEEGQPADGDSEPEEGEPADGETVPEEGQPADGETVPEEGKSTDGDSKPEEGQPADGETVPEEGQSADGETVPEGGKSTDGESKPEEGQPADGESKPEEGQAADGETVPEEGKSTDGESKPEEGQPADGETEHEEGKTADGEPLPEGGKTALETEENNDASEAPESEGEIVSEDRADGAGNESDADLIVIGPNTSAQPEAQQPTGRKRLLKRSAPVNQSTASHDTALLRLSLQGEATATMSLRPVRPEAGSHQQVLEAYAVVDSANCTGVNVMLLNQPEMESGEYLALYGLQNGELSAGPLMDHLIPGDSHVFSLSLWDGFALVRLGEKEYQQLTPVETGDALIQLSGLLPVDAEVEIQSVKGYESEEGETLLACDISIRDAAGDSFQPDADNPVEVTVHSEAIRAALEKGSALKAYHYADEKADPEEVEITAAEGDAVTFAATGFSVYTVVEVTKEQILTASDGNTYKITVTYDTSTGIPEDAELVVSELTEADASYAEYVEKAASAVGADAENHGFAYAFDISLVDPVTGTHYQPTKPLAVSVQLLNEEVQEGDDIGVVHFPDSHAENPDEEAVGTELLTARVVDGAVEFESTGFSVYVIIDHEGGKIRTPRVEFHFLSEKYENPDNQHLEIFTASPFYFVNKKGKEQNSEIVKNGETLEVIMNPPNIQIEVEDPENPGQMITVSKYFFGWYIVNETDVDPDTGKVTYTWTADPEQLTFEQPVTIDPDKIVWANEEHTAITSLVWELNGVEHTAENTAETVSGTGETIPARTMVDEFGCAHVYLAPIYQDYYFVNFHAGVSSSELGNSIINRRLVVLGSDGEAEVRIGDVTAPSDDMQHKIFTGWSGLLWDETGAGGGEMATQEMTTLDEVGDEYNSGPDKDGFYITVGSHDLHEGKMSVDLYPIFTEARWFHFRTGGRGSTYVGDTYVYTTDAPSDVENGTARYYLTDMATSSRTGYRFKGWYADAQETDSYGDYIDGIQITDENGQIVNSAYTKYEDAAQQIPLYQLKDGRLYVYKALDAKAGVTLYAHWEEITDTTIQVIVWKQKVSDDKTAFDFQKSYDFEASYTVDTTSGLTLSDLQANNVLQQYENASFTGFHYRTTTMNTDATRGDGSTVVNVYYDRDLMTIYFYYNGGGEPAYTYTETTDDDPAEQYGIVEGEYVPLIRKQGNGMKYTFRHAYQPTTSDTIVPQFALVSYSGGLKLYEELTREVNTITNTRWKFQTGNWGRRTTRYMDQGTTDGKFYVWQGSGFWGSFVESGYTVGNPPPANGSENYYCYYNYRYYELEPQSTTTTTYTWKLGDDVWTGTRYRRLAGTEEYTGSLYTVSGPEHDGETFGIDNRGGYVELNGTQVSAYQWYAMTHVDGRYEIDNLNNGTHQPVYGLVDGEYVRLTPIQGDTYTYATENTYTASTAAEAQYGLVDGEYVPLTRHASYSYNRTGYTYTRSSNDNDNNPQKYGVVNGNIAEISYERVDMGYYIAYQWVYSDNNQLYLYTGYRYTQSDSNSNAYTDKLYYTVISGTAGNNESGFTQTDIETGDNLYGRAGNSNNRSYFQLSVTDNSYYTLSDGSRYNGTRYARSAGADWTGQRLTRTGDAAPYTYTIHTGNPGVGQKLYVVDGNGGHVPLNWNVNVTGYTYTDEGGTVHTYTGDRYSYRAEGEVETEYTGTRYTRSAVSVFNSMLTYTGLYGQTLEQNGYSWPANIPGESGTWWWYERYSSSYYGNMSGSGTRTTFMNAFLFSEGGTVETYYGFKNTGTNHIYFYQEELDGSWKLSEDVTTGSGGGFYISDKYNGFYAYQYNPDGTNWFSAGSKNGGYYNNGQSVSYNDSLHIRFKRILYDLIFDPNYPTLAGTTIGGTEITLNNKAELTAANTVTLTVPYGAPLSDYSAQPQPAQGPDHYSFTGWYVDSGCTVPYTFNEKMPDANMRLYAGWTAVRFRIKIDPNGGEFDHINHKWNNSSDNLALRGYADSGAAWWWVDNGDGTRTAKQYSPEAYNPNTWTPFENFNRRQILAPNGAVERAADSGWAATSRYSTYINAYYMGSITEYTEMKCEYVPISDAAAETYEGQIYYYMNAQFQSDAIDGTGLPSANRSALYLTEDELHDYYLFYANWVKANLVGGYISGTTILDEETWRITYVSPQKYRHTLGSEHYAFLGWYKLDANGNPESMPYNFADPVTGEFTLKAFWRLDAEYQIRYHADYTMDDGAIINGSIPYWTDPQLQTEHYADNAETEVYRQPTGITANNIPTEEYIFRGWRLVSISTNSQGQVVYIPIESGVYYDPGDPFTIRAAFADRSSIIHMQAVYESKDSAYRRPHVTNLALNANGGFLTLDGVNRLTENTGLSDTWDGVVGTVAATVTTNTGDTALIEFGDIQSNEKVRLYRYATELDHVDGDATKAALDPAGKNYFKHPDNYFLLGFDDESNEGDYIATYPSDAVMAVPRNEKQTVYAVWEPLVYIKVVNATDVGPVTFGLSSDEGALQVVNARNGLYGRTPMTASEMSAITVADGDYVWLAVPYGVVKEIQNGQTVLNHRHVSFEGTNNLGAGWLLTADCTLGGTTRALTGTLTASDADYTSVQNQKPFGFSDALEIDPEGIVITFTAIRNPNTLVLDDNNPTTGVRTKEIYFDTKTNVSSTYGYDVVYGQDEALYYDLPSTSTRVGYIFLGWDPDPAWVRSHNPKTEKPAYSTGSATGWRISSLNDFFDNGTELEPVKTLYAVWDNSAEAKFVYVYKEVPEPGDQNKEFRFTVALSGQYDYSTKNATNKNQQFTVSGNGTFTLKHGEYLEIQSAIVNSGSGTWTPKLETKIQKYNADNTTQGSEVALSWTWNDVNSSNGTYRSFSFHDLSYTVTEDDYSTSQYYDTALTCTALASDTYPLILNSTAASIANLPVENVEGRVLSWTNTEAGGRVVFTNTRQTADVTVKKELVSNANTAGIFNYTASYTLDGRTTTLDPFTVTSGTRGKTLKDIPVGAQLTVTELGQNLNDYITTAKIGDAAATVTETTETANGATTYKRSITYTVARNDATITYTNTLKSYPITFYKVKQDGTAGVPSYFKIASSTGLIAEQLYPAQTGTGEFFPHTSGKDNRFYVGSYTLTETFVGSNFLPLEGPVTLTLSADNGGELESSNADYVKVEKVDPADPSQGFKVTIYNQQIVRINIAKTLVDPILSGTRTFLFRVQYKNDFLGKTISYDNYDPSKENNGLLSVLSSSRAEIKVPLGARELTISEDTSSIVVDTTTIAEAYDTSVQRKPKTGDAEAVQSASSYSYTSPVTTEANDGDTITFTNARKTVNITVGKTVIAEDGSPLLNENYAVAVSVKNGAIPIRDYTVSDNGTAADTSDDLVTDDNGGVSFTLTNNEQRQIKIPVGASVWVQENLTDGQKAEDLVPFILMPGGKENMSSGDSSVFELLGPTEDKDIRIFNVPAICKVTSESDDTDKDNVLLYNIIEGGDTPDDTSDDIYMPAVFGTIKSAFNCINDNKLYFKNGSGESATYSRYNGGYKVKMLRDYRVPNSDVVEVNAGFTLTFTTAGVADTDGYPFRRSGAAAAGALPANVSADDSIGRAILTRESASTKAFFTVNEEEATEKTTFTMSELIIDGDGKRANPGNDVKGGCLTAFYADVTIDHCVVYNFEAKHGGAVYTTGDSLTVNNTVFDTCISRLSGNGNGGGAINTSAVSLKIDDSSFRSCTSVFQGGAVYQHGVASGTSIDDSGKDKTAEISNCTFDSCASRAGGGCELDVGSVTLTGCTFKNCTATVDSGSGGNGGGLNNYTADFKDDTYPSTMTVSGCTFENCIAAKNAENGGTPYGGGMRSDALETRLSSCTFTGCQSEYDGGGAAFTNNKTDTSATVEGCTFTSCTAESGGGIYSQSALTVQQVGSDQTAVQTSLTSCTATNGGGVHASGTTTIKDSTAITSCEATNGGGVYANATTTVEGSAAITSCKATNGGGVYVYKNTTVKGSATISSCEATADGGGVYVANDKLTVSDSCSITANQAATGAGVYVFSNPEKKNTMTMSGGSITANVATTSGGGIAVGGTNVALYFSGTARVGGAAAADNNTANDSLAAGKCSNVCLDQDSNEIIHASNHLSEEAYIGVYVPGQDTEAKPGDDNGTLYDWHGEENAPFGTDDKNANFLNHFVNDRNTELVGGRLSSGDKQIYWIYPICKIIDKDGNLLYKNAACTEPALYFKLGKGENKYDGSYAFNALISNSEHPLYSAKNTPYTGSEYCIKMLVENYSWVKYINVEAGKTITFTTAGENDAQYPYRGTSGTYATITRTDNPQNTMFTSRGTLKMTNITLDGGATMSDAGVWSRILCNQVGGILVNKAGGSLIIGKNATLRNSYTTNASGGGAVANDTGNGKNVNNSIIIQGGKIENCGAANNGGAVYVGSGKLEMTGGEITTCRASLGSAVYVAGINEVMGAYFAGGSIERNTATGENGGAVNAANNKAKLYFGALKLKNGSTVIGGNPVIRANVKGSETRNVVLDQDTNVIINTTANGLRTKADGSQYTEDAYIGVYVTGSDTAGSGSVYDKHGGYKDDFGTYDHSADTGASNLDCFHNDRNGMFGEEDPNNNYLIRWTNYVCKIVDTDNTEHVFTSINAAVEHSRGNNKDYVYNADYGREVCTIQMLVDYVIPQSDCVVLGFNDKNHNGTKDNGEEDTTDDIIITTAAIQSKLPDGEKYFFTPNLTLDGRLIDDVKEGNVVVTPKDSGEKAILQRGWSDDQKNTDSLFNINNDTASLTTQNIIFDGKSKIGTETALTQKTGRMVYVGAGALSIGKGTTVRSFQTPGNGGAVYSAGGVTVSGTGTGTKRVKFWDCSATKSNDTYYNGGAIYTAGNTTDTQISISNADFEDCFVSSTVSDGGRGGAMYFTNGTQHLEDVNVDGVADDHKDSKGIDAYHGGGIYLANGNMTLTHVVLHDCHVNGNGGGIYMAGPSTLTVNGKTVGTDNKPSEFKECAAPKGNGGAIYNEGTGTVNIVNTTIDGHFAHPNNVSGPNGSEEPSTTPVDPGEITTPENPPEENPEGDPELPTPSNMDGIISDNTHLEDDVPNAKNGGAIYVKDGTLSLGGSGNDSVTINNCTVTLNGGAIYIASSVNSETGTVSLNNVIIDGHDQSRAGGALPATFVNAQNGGAIYLGSGTLSITGGKLQNLRAHNHGGAIYNNSSDKMSAAGANNATVLINGTVFTGRTSATSDMQGHANAASGGMIYINTGNLRVSGAQFLDFIASQEGGAIYDNNRNGYTDIDTVNLQNVTIDGHAGGLLDTEANAQLGGGIYTAVLGELSKGGSIRLNKCTLLDCVASEQGGAIYNASTRRNASTGAGDEPTVHLVDTVIDGHETLLAANLNAKRGGAILLANGTLHIDGSGDGSSSEIRDCKVSADGGAICSYGGGTQFKNQGVDLEYKEFDYTIKLNNTTIAECTAGTNGGGINIKQILVMKNARIIKCHANENGGAIALFGDKNNKRDVRMNDSTYNQNVISGNTAGQNGAGIYLPENSKLSLAGSPYFGSKGTDTDGNLTGSDTITVMRKIDTSGNTADTARAVEVVAGNFVTKAMPAGARNGGKAYLSDKHRQDIYIAGYLGTSSYTPATSLYVTGAIPNNIDPTTNIGDKDGTIWVMAEIPTTENENNHYQQLKQFAVMTDGVAEADRESTIRVFRNAADDESTQNGTDSYLTGSLEGDLTVPSGANYARFIYWTGSSGSRRVILRKVGDNHEALAGATFNMYKGSSMSIFVLKHPDKTEETMGEYTEGGIKKQHLVSLNSGVIWIGDLPYGWYILYETKAPDGYADTKNWFYLVVDEDGVVDQPMIGYENRTDAENAGKAKFDKRKDDRKKANASGNTNNTPGGTGNENNNG